LIFVPLSLLQSVPKSLEEVFDTQILHQFGMVMFLIQKNTIEQTEKKTTGDLA